MFLQLFRGLTIQYIGSERAGRGLMVLAMADDTGKKEGAGLKDLVTAESMIQLALAIPLGCLVGWAIGAWLDSKFHQGWIAVTGIVLGAVGGFIQIYRTTSRFLNRDG